nr:MAG TPA: hypothetical protein [Caudoviricetes sp.]
MAGHKNKTRNPASQREITGSPPKNEYKNTTGRIDWWQLHNCF